MCLPTCRRPCSCLPTRLPGPPPTAPHTCRLQQGEQQGGARRRAVAVQQGRWAGSRANEGALFYVRPQPSHEPLQILATHRRAAAPPSLAGTRQPTETCHGSPNMAATFSQTSLKTASRFPRRLPRTATPSSSVCHSKRGTRTGVCVQGAGATPGGVPDTLLLLLLQAASAAWQAACCLAAAAGHTHHTTHDMHAPASPEAASP